MKKIENRSNKRYKLNLSIYEYLLLALFDHKRFKILSFYYKYLHHLFTIFLSIFIIIQRKTSKGFIAKYILSIATPISPRSDKTN